MRTVDFNSISYSGIDKVNEDYVLCHKLSDNCLIAILADGMGGLSYGAEAARIASESVLSAIIDKIQESSPENVLQFAFNVADIAIRNKCRDLKCKMGTALTVALIINDSLYYAWQGNVRLYKVEKNGLALLTIDHIASETDTTLLTRCVNGKGYRESIPVMHEHMKPYDRFLICSDGCYHHIDLIKLVKTNHNISYQLDNMQDDCSLIEIKLV